MPARHFFVMLRGARQMRAFYFSELCDIAAIPMCNEKYYRGLKASHQMNMARDENPEPIPQYRKTPLEGDTAKYAMMTLFHHLKRRA